MEVITINNAAEIDIAAKKAVAVLKKGGLIIYPTDTVYGLGANALDKSAVQKIFEIKCRNKSNPVSIAFKNIDAIEKFAYLNVSAKILAKTFLPGALTLILSAKSEFDKMLGGQKIGVRIIDHPFVSALLNNTDFPVITTSANLSGGKTPITANDAIQQIGNKVDLVIDFGACKAGLPSTIADVSNDKIKIVREGSIKAETINAAIDGTSTKNLKCC